MSDPENRERDRAVAIVALGRVAAELGLVFDVVTAIRSGAPAADLSAVIFSDVATALMGDQMTFETAQALERARAGT